MVLFVAPLRERQACWRFAIGGLMMVVLLSFCLFSTTVLAEPAIAQVEKVCGLMHILTKHCALIFVLCLSCELTTTDKAQSTRHTDREVAYRRASGESINRTGTLVRLPSRHI